MAKEVEIEVTFNEGVGQTINSRLLRSCIEYLLYQRQQLPMPYHELRRMVEDQEKLCDGLEAGVIERPLARRSFNTEYKKAKKVYEDVECLFDHINKLFLSTIVKSALVLIGSTAVSPKEHYFVDFQNAQEVDTADTSARVCNSACRKLIRSLISNQELGSFKEISPTSMLVFIQASRSSDIEWFRPKPTFKPPHRGHSCKISVRTATCSEQMAASDPPDHSMDEWLWFQAPVNIRGYSHKTGVGL
ncbi:MAD2L1-binding protein-like [Oculina patagonica]